MSKYPRMWVGIPMLGTKFVTTLPQTGLIPMRQINVPADGIVELRVNEQITVGDAKVSIKEISPSQVKIMIDAPSNIRIMRAELLPTKIGHNNLET